MNALSRQAATSGQGSLGPCLLPLEAVTVFYAMSCSLRCWLSWVYMDGSHHEPGGDCRISSGKVAQPIPEVIIVFLPD